MKKKDQKRRKRKRKSFKDLTSFNSEEEYLDHIYASLVVSALELDKKRKQRYIV